MLCCWQTVYDNQEKKLSTLLIQQQTDECDQITPVHYILMTTKSWWNISRHVINCCWRNVLCLRTNTPNFLTCSILYVIIISKTVRGPRQYYTQYRQYTVEMGRSLADAEVRPKNSAECSVRQHVTIRPNFGKYLASFVASHLRHFAPATGVN